MSKTFFDGTVKKVEIRPNPTTHHLTKTQQAQSEQLYVKAAKTKRVVALFSGASGTGKTVVAEAVAQQLGRDLLIVSAEFTQSYIGETEKNISALLNKAAANDWILFFDEADALFGRRAGKSNFLLQRIETHSGLLIFSTLKSSPDADITISFGSS